MRMMGATRTAGAAGECGLEHTLQFGGLIAGQLAAGHLTRDQVVDLRLEAVGRFGAAGLVLARLLCSEEAISVSAEDSGS